jgi:opacity protein-like surface antigen
LLSSNWNVGFTLGAGFGPEIMGSRSEHHLAAGILHVGKLLNSGKPGLRNLELGGELWAGGQYHPEAAYVSGLTPVVRYHFRRDSRWRPFLDAGLGFVLTDIGLPDLSTTYQFSPQAGAGFHWELREHLALTLQARYIHISNAGFEMPNFGVNTFLFSGGLTRFF